MSGMETDADLVAKAKQSDPTALMLLLMRYETELANFIERALPARVRSSVSVDDIRQIAWEEAFRTIGRFEYRGERSFFAWLRTIADHRVKDALRTCDVVRSLFADADASSPLVVDPVDPGLSPSREAGRGEAIAKMRQAMESLPADYRTVLELRFIQGEAMAEVAKRMQRSSGAVAMLTLRALESLHAAMGSTWEYLTRKA